MNTIHIIWIRFMLTIQIICYNYNSTNKKNPISPLTWIRLKLTFNMIHSNARKSIVQCFCDHRSDGPIKYPTLKGDPCAETDEEEETGTDHIPRQQRPYLLQLPLPEMLTGMQTELPGHRSKMSPLQETTKQIRRSRVWRMCLAPHRNLQTPRLPHCGPVGNRKIHNLLISPRREISAGTVRGRRSFSAYPGDWGIRPNKHFSHLYPQMHCLPVVIHMKYRTKGI